MRRPPGASSSTTSLVATSVLKLPPGKSTKSTCARLVEVDDDPDLRRVDASEVLVLDGVDVVDDRPEAQVLLRRPHDARLGLELDPVEHVGVEHAGLGYRGEGERDDHALAGSVVRAREPEHVVDVGGADVDVREDRVDGIRVVVVGHTAVATTDVAEFRTAGR